jgi:hypothetical protein
MEREFRGPSITQVNAATQQREATKKAQRDAVLLQLAQDAAAKKAVEDAAKAATPTQSATATTAKAATPSQNVVATTPSATAKAATVYTTPTGRFERVYQPPSENAVHGMTLSEYNAAEAAKTAEVSKAAATAKAVQSVSAPAAAVAAASKLSTASTNNKIVGGVTQSEYWDISNQLSETAKAAQSYGISVAVPSQSQYASRAAAQAALDAYVSKINSALEAQATAQNNAAQAAAADKTVTSGGITKVYTIQNGKLGNISKGKFYALSDYELIHDVHDVTYDISGSVTGFSTGATKDQVSANQAKYNANRITNVDPSKTSGYSFKYTMSNAQAEAYYTAKQNDPNLTEYQFRTQKGIATDVVSGSYSKPVAGTHKTISAKVGSGDKKIAQIKATGANNNSSAKTGTAQAAKATVISPAATKSLKTAATNTKKIDAQTVIANAQQAAQAKKDTEAQLKVQQASLVKAQAAAKKTANPTVKAALQKEVKTLQKDVNTTKDQVKVASEAAAVTSKLANAVQETAHYTEIAQNTGSVVAAKKAATASKVVLATQPKAASAVKAASAAKISDHTGQILLKDGTWIDQIQRKGNSVEHEAVGVFSSQKALNKSQADAKATAKKSAAESAQQRASYKEVLGKDGKIIDAIQKIGATSVGEDPVTIYTQNAKTGKITSRSGTAEEYSQALKSAKKIAEIPVTATTSASDRKAITEARNYVAARASGVNYHKIDQSAFVAGVGLGAVEAANESNTSFKTRGQLRKEAAIARGGLGAAGLKLGQKLTDSYNSTAKALSDKKSDLNKQISEIINIPELNEIEKIRNASFTKVGLEDKRLAGQKAIYGNKYGAAAMNLGKESYNKVKDKPVDAAITVAGLYASGLVAGAVVEGGLGAVAAGAGKVALRAKSPLLKTGAALASKYTPTVGHLGLGAAVASEGIETLRSGDADRTVRFVSSFIVGGMGYSKGAKIAKDPITAIPGVKRIKIQEMPEGASSLVNDIEVGKSLVVAGKPIVSYSKATGLVKDIIEAPESLTKGKKIQAYDKLGIKSLEKAFKTQLDADTNLRYASSKRIADAVYRQSSPVTKPSEFKIASKDIPDSMKPVVADAVKSYPGLLKLHGMQVYGSATQKLQMEGYFSRTPKDLEVSVSNTDRFVQVFRKKASKAGFKEGTDYNVNTYVTEGPFKTKADAQAAMRKITAEGKISKDVEKIYKLKHDSSGYNFDWKGRYTKARGGNPKVEFKTGDKWEKGIEVFSHKSAPVMEYETNLISSGLRIEPNIAFGFKPLRSAKADGVNIMKLQEQAARKLEGSTVLVDRKLIPKHEGREKDIRDLIEIGTAYEVTKGIGIGKSVIDYALTSAKEFSSVSESPIASFIVSKKRLPTDAEIKVLISGGKLSTKEADVVLKFKKTQSADATTGVPLGSRLLRKYKEFMADTTASTNPGAVRKLEALKDSVKDSGKDTNVKQKSSSTTKQKPSSTSHKKLAKETKKQTASKAPEKKGVPLQRRFRSKKVAKEEKELIYESTALKTKVTRELESMARKSSTRSRIGSKAVHSVSAKKPGSTRASSVAVSRGKQSSVLPSKASRSKSTLSKSTYSKAGLPISTSSRNSPSKAVLSKASPGSVPSKAVHLKSVPSKIAPPNSIPSKVAPSKSVPSKSVPSKSVPSKSVPSKSVPSKSVPSKSVPSKSVPSKSAPSRSTPSKTMPSKEIYSKGSTGSSAKIIRFAKNDTIIRRRKRIGEIGSIKTPKDFIKLQRKIQNNLGSLESMFSDSPTKKSGKRSTKTVKTSKKR